MAGNLKCKNVVSDESIKDVKKLSLEKLNLGRKKKFVVLCLDELMVHTKDKNNVRGFKPDVVHGRFRGLRAVYVCSTTTSQFSQLQERVQAVFAAAPTVKLAK
ncbi:Uncharacterized protein Fot_25446 [Forsythia ovata]|uniref:Uncharacterized protein n=1 Tax=Forsythia ovata TaxID=205694 RepID=A0ABD1UA65_9LAMI